VADFRLVAETRTEFGKGSARRTRRAGRIPAVLYGHGQDVVHLSLPAREFAAALRNGGSQRPADHRPGRQGAAGPDQGRPARPADPPARARRPAARPPRREDHRRGAGRRRRRAGAGHDPQPPAEHRLRSRPTPRGCPTTIEVDVTGRTAGENITAGDLVLPAGATLITDPEALVIGFLGAPTAEALEAELAEAEAEAGIEREESARPPRAPARATSSPSRRTRAAASRWTPPKSENS
jgi:large subunit ribosomal protein L25